MMAPFDCFIAEGGKWISGRVLEFLPAGPSARNALAIVATDGGRLVAVLLESVRHGEKPKSLPVGHDILQGFKKPLMRQDGDKFIVVSADGVIAYEGIDEDKAKVKLAVLEEAAKPVAQPGKAG